MFLIFSIHNAVRQQVDQKYDSTFYNKNLIQAKLAILDLKVMCPHLHHHHERVRLIQSCLFNPFKNKKIHFLFCTNTGKTPVLFTYIHYVPLIMFF